MKTESMVLLVMARNRRPELLVALENCATDVLAVCDCREACTVLRASMPVQVVFTDAVLPDGGWSDVMEAVEQNRPHAQVVVCTRKANVRFWGDVIQGGAFDLLEEPYEEDEIQRVVEVASARSYMRGYCATQARG